MVHAWGTQQWVTLSAACVGCQETHSFSEHRPPNYSPASVVLSYLCLSCRSPWHLACLVPTLYMSGIAPRSLPASGHFYCFGIQHIFMAMAMLAVLQQRWTSLQGWCVLGEAHCGSSSSTPLFPSPSVSLPCWLWVGPQDGILRTGPWSQSTCWPEWDGHPPAHFSFSWSVALNVIFALA